MGRTLKPETPSWYGMTHNWWQKILFSLILVTTTVGVVYIAYRVCRRIIKSYKTKSKPEVLSSRASKCLEHFTTQVVPRSKAATRKISSFSAYLGPIDSPPTAAQLNLLTRSDLTILDPYRTDVDNVPKDIRIGCFLARVDLTIVLSQDASSDDLIEELASLTLAISSRSQWAGLLLVGWEDCFSRICMDALLRVIEKSGLLLYLETAPPRFLRNDSILSDKAVSGLVIRNAVIFPDGQHRDYFDMELLQPTLKASARECCYRDFNILAWDEIENEILVTNAVLKRGIKWCDFYNIVLWVGSPAALNDATLNDTCLEPLGAFDWLKDDDVIKAHRSWRQISSIRNERADPTTSAWTQISQILPNTATFLESNQHSSLTSKKAPTSRSTSRLTGSISTTRRERSPRPLSNMHPLDDQNHYIRHMGCFPLGVEVTPLALAEVWKTQLRLKELGLAQSMDAATTVEIGRLIRKFHYRHLLVAYENDQDIIEAVKELYTMACNGLLKVNVHLNPSFGHCSGARFWAICTEDPEGAEVYISKDAQDIIGTILHVFLSSKGFARDTCMEMEAALARWSEDLDENSGLPRRLHQDIDLLSPEERITLLQQITNEEHSDDISASVGIYIKKCLIDTISMAQLNEQNSFGYLSGEATISDILKARIAWYDQQEVCHPSMDAALVFSSQWEYIMQLMLQNRRESDLKSLLYALKDMLSVQRIDAWADLLALVTFCCMRSAALDEIYLEVIDRNPLLNDQSDQAAVFAESFALGSRCEAYFDMTPDLFGKLLSDRFRSEYEHKQPPTWVNGAPEFATVYSGAQIDVDKDRTTKALPQFQRFTALSVFAVPALVDIILLTTSGRGLYLSAFMSVDEQRIATIALLAALLVSGAAGTSIACGGSYYLISMAFSAMNVFVLTRLIAGVAFAMLGAAIAFLIITGIEGAYLAAVFALYFVGFMAYLTLFAAIASFQFPGSSFLSGRKYIFFCLPWLLISPIATMYTGHDVPVYLATMYLVIALLTMSLRYVGALWVSWYKSIRQTEDAEIRKWYTMTKCAGEKSILQSMTDPGALKVAREALYEDVCAELNRGSFTKPTEDKLVRELAADYEATSFLLDWYCRHADLPRPVPYSSSWNIQTKVALNILRDAQKGHRVHSAFIHWHQTGDEIGCGTLYFMVALLDKWVELLSGVHLTGLSASLNDQNRVAVGFGLAYYLIGAVLIDIRAQDLHEFVNLSEPEGIRTGKEFRASQKRSVLSRRAMYYRTLLRFMAWHCWSLTFSATLVWVFQDSAQTVFMFLAYVFAYTGLLWYQYTKIFSGSHALKPLLLAVCVGLPIGLVLKKTMPHFLYSGVITLAIGTWTAAIFCLWSAGISTPTEVTRMTVEGAEEFHAYTKPWADPEWSQIELQTTRENLESTPLDSRLAVTPLQYPGLEAKRILLSCHPDHLAETAFPNWEELISRAIDAWEGGEVEIQMIPLSTLGSGIRALSHRMDGRIILMIGVANDKQRSSSIREDPKVIAELLLHEIAEVFFGMTQNHAHLTSHIINSIISYNIRLLLDDETDLLQVSAWAKRESLKQQCCGLDCDLNWDQLPQEARNVFLYRCLGQSEKLSRHERESLLTVLDLLDSEELDLHIARCDLGKRMVADLMEYATTYSKSIADVPDSGDERAIEAPSRIMSFLRMPMRHAYHAIGLTSKLVVVAMLADAEAQRELDYLTHDQHSLIRVPLTFAINSLWIYAKFVQDVALPFFVFHRRPHIKELWESSQGATILHKRNRMIIQGQKPTETAFKRREPTGGFKLYYYDGIHQVEPARELHLLRAVCQFNDEKELLRKDVYEHGEISEKFEYVYQSAKTARGFLERRKPRIPERRRCTQGPLQDELLSYNESGIVSAGAHVRNGQLAHFTLSYRKNGHYQDELLRAEYTMASASCTISWCAPPRRHAEKLEKWIPHSKVMEATFVQGLDEYQSKWIYDHRFHPMISTTLNGRVTATPPMIEHDLFGVLTKPSLESFVEENPYINSGRSRFDILLGTFGYAKRLIPISISQGRSRMWKTWRKGNTFDGVIMEWLDERLLRKDRVLAPYWRYRNVGNLVEAKKYLNKNADAVVASADLDDEVSGWTPLAIKLDDLYNFGAAGDAILHTRSEDVGYDSSTTLHVLAADNGTWPMEGGGVSACRRDIVNSLQSVKWHMLCESATDFGVPKYQTERNVHSLKVVPLWGLDFLSPTHGLFKNRLHAEVNAVSSNATDLEIQLNFVPSLAALVKGARATQLSSADLQQATRALVSLNDFFQHCRNWSQVWTSGPARHAWKSLWLDQDMPNARPSSEWLDTELPTLGHLDIALELWFRYLFVFSVRVPDQIPAVYQVSHHSVSAAYGVVCKVKRNCQLHVWDHGISWRESNMCLSATLCKLPPFVRNALLGLMRLTSVLVLHHADVVLPCADFFNPGWETEIGTCQGTLEHRNKFRRKIAPVVNGITDAEKFKPVKEITTRLPTVTMLSHLWFAKDLKTAILAADIIINQWGFSDYRLDIYGSIEKAPAYSNECAELIASKSLGGQVSLCGTADPLKVLEQTWLFMNSSLSEGLPLALGEAALTGVPVVATDVGASLRVLTDPETSERYSAVVAPNDPRALARAQIKLLALLDEWSPYASNSSDSSSSPSSLPSSPTRADITAITARMYTQAPARRALGLRNRAIVEKSFGGARYLREHEQMLWIGKSAHMMAERMRQATTAAGGENDPLRSPALITAPDPAAVRVIPRSVAPSYYRSVSPGPGYNYSRSMSPAFGGSVMSSVYGGSGGGISIRPPSRLTSGSSGSLLAAPTKVGTGSNASGGSVKKPFLAGWRSTLTLNRPYSPSPSPLGMELEEGRGRSVTPGAARQRRMTTTAGRATPVEFEGAEVRGREFAG